MGVPERVAGGDEVEVDVVVVGAGIAGLVAALDLLEADPSLSVALVDKGAMGTGGSTPLAQGGMAAAVGPGDAPALHAEDTIRAGDGLCDPRAVHVMAEEVVARIGDLERRGARFDRGPDGAFALSREGGQRVPRSVKAADATGAEIFRALRVAAVEEARREGGRLGRLQGLAVALVQGGRADAPAAGVWVLLDDIPAPVAGPVQTAGLLLVRAGAVLLASGGCGGLYAATTNRDAATADGVALAALAGADLVDLEFVQFHPTGLRSREGGYWRFLLTEALRGAGAVLLDASGRRFMADRHPDAELAPRHVVTKGILEAEGGAWLDATSLARERLEEEFPTVLAGAARFGFDLATEPLPVEPCEHYLIGGVATDLDGRTTVPHLWAAGETACTGVHGANRMAGNSLAQSAVFGHRAARSIVAALPARPAPAADPPAPVLGPAAGPPDADVLRSTIRESMTAGAGPVRTEASLRTTAEAIAGVAGRVGPVPAASRDGLELRSAVLVGSLLVRSALLRRESRGVHWRDDAPGHDPAWGDRRLRVRAGGLA